MADALAALGCEIRVEDGPLSVSRVIGAFRPDVLVVAAVADDVDTVVATCRRAKTLGDVPVVVVPDAHLPGLCLAVLAAGAEDCVAASDPGDLILARVRGVLARRGRVAAPAVQIGDLLIDGASHAVLRDGEPVELSPLEFRLLAELARHPGVVVRKTDLRNRLWNGLAGPNSVEQAVSRLRRKLDGSCAVRSIRGVGYVLCERDLAA